jgi:hypothetical protein
MLRPEIDRERPAGDQAPSNVISDGTTAIIPPSTLQHPKAIAPAFAVLVMRRDGHWRRQLYCSLHSAQKAMERASKNGIEARCQLVEIVPVPSSPLVVVEGGAA